MTWIEMCVAKNHAIWKNLWKAFPLTPCLKSAEDDGWSNEECGVKVCLELMDTFLGMVNLGITEDAAAAAAKDKPVDVHNCG